MKELVLELILNGMHSPNAKGMGLLEELPN
jgi:hypothetical protein